MNLQVQPDDLAAAGMQLAAVASRLEDVRGRLGWQVAANGPGLGTGAQRAVSDTARAADRTLGVLTDDLTEMSRALRTLAAVYHRLDETAVGR